MLYFFTYLFIFCYILLWYKYLLRILYALNNFISKTFEIKWIIVECQESKVSIKDIINQVITAVFTRVCLEYKVIFNVSALDVNVRIIKIRECSTCWNQKTDIKHFFVRVKFNSEEVIIRECCKLLNEEFILMEVVYQRLFKLCWFNELWYNRL